MKVTLLTVLFILFLSIVHNPLPSVIHEELPDVPALHVPDTVTSLRGFSFSSCTRMVTSAFHRFRLLLDEETVRSPTCIVEAAGGGVGVEVGVGVVLGVGVGVKDAVGVGVGSVPPPAKTSISCSQLRKLLLLQAVESIFT